MTRIQPAPPSYRTGDNTTVYRLLADEVYLCRGSLNFIGEAGNPEAKFPPEKFKYVGSACDRLMELSLINQIKPGLLDQKEQTDQVDDQAREGFSLYGESAKLRLRLCACTTCIICSHDIPGPKTFDEIASSSLLIWTVVITSRDRNLGEHYWRFPNCTFNSGFFVSPAEVAVVPVEIQVRPIIKAGLYHLGEWRKL